MAVTCQEEWDRLFYVLSEHFRCPLDWGLLTRCVLTGFLGDLVNDTCHYTAARLFECPQDFYENSILLGIFSIGDVPLLYFWWAGDV